MRELTAEETARFAYEAETLRHCQRQYKSTPVEAYGVKGMKSTPWRKTFKSEAAMVAWLEKDDGNVQVLGTRKLD